MWRQTEWWPGIEWTEREIDMDVGKKKRKKWNWMKIKVGAGIAGIAAAVAVFTVLLQIEKSAMEQYEKAYVCMAATDIPEGEVITEKNSGLYLELVEMEIRYIPTTALRRIEAAEGLAAVFDVEKGVFLTVGMFEDKEEILGNMEEPVIAGFKADDIYQVAGGVLRAGDRIHLIQITNEGAELLWENIYVQSVFDQSGVEIPNADTVKAAQRVNVYLDKEDVEEFYDTLTSGTVRVVKVCK